MSLNLTVNLLVNPFLQVFIKSELKVGVIYVKENQYTEEEILDNNENSPMFDEFLQVLGEKVRLKGKERGKLFKCVTCSKYGRS